MSWPLGKGGKTGGMGGEGSEACRVGGNKEASLAAWAGLQHSPEVRGSRGSCALEMELVLQVPLGLLKAGVVT